MKTTLVSVGIFAAAVAIGVAAKAFWTAKNAPTPAA